MKEGSDLVTARTPPARRQARSRLQTVGAAPPRRARAGGTVGTRQAASRSTPLCKRSLLLQPLLRSVALVFAHWRPRGVLRTPRLALGAKWLRSPQCGHCTAGTTAWARAGRTCLKQPLAQQRGPSCAAPRGKARYCARAATVQTPQSGEGGCPHRAGASLSRHQATALAPELGSLRELLRRVASPGWGRQQSGKGSCRHQAAPQQW